MNFFNKLESRKESNIIQEGGKSDKNITITNTIENTENNLQNNEPSFTTSPEIQVTQDNINKFKKYISLINPDHHYFINYNDCYDKVSDILLAKDENNVQELRNNIKVGLSKYKQTKNYNFTTSPTSIEVFDLKKNHTVETIDIPICINLKEIHNKALKNLNNIYTKTKLAYELLMLNEDNTDSKLSEFKKLRYNCEKKINEYYIVQYLLNFLSKYNPNNEHFTTHTIQQVYSTSKENTKTLLVLGNSHLNQNIIDSIIELESELLDNYNQIKQLLNTGNISEDKELKNNIKEYIEKKKTLENKIKKINDIKTKERSTTIYLTESQIARLNISTLKNYTRTITGHKAKDNFNSISSIIRTDSNNNTI